MRVQSALEANSQLPKARKPGMRALHHPTVSAKPLTAFHPSTGNSRLNSPSSQVCPAAAIVVTLVRMKLVRLLPGPAGQARDGGKRINQRFEGNRVMTVGPGNAQRQWRATTIYDDVPLAAKLSPVGGIAACFLASPWAGYASGVNAGAAPVNLIVLAQLGQQSQMQTIPDALRLPVPESSPAGHPAAKAQFFWQVFPRNAGGENEQNAIERGKIIDPWSPALYRTSGWHKQ